MIREVLGILDLFASLFLILLIFGVGGNIALYFVAYLVIKSLIFIREFSSWVDLMAALFIVLTFFGMESKFTWIFVVWLAEKGFVSLLQ